MITIGIDPQPTLTAMCIHINDKYYVIGKKLCTSKRNKKNQITRWLNHDPEIFINHLDELFHAFEDPMMQCPIVVGVEMQIKARSTLLLEAYIKSYLCTRFRNIVSCKSIRAIDWQKGIMDRKIEKRKDYFAETWDEMMRNNNVSIHIDDDVKGRRIDLVDAYLICKYTERIYN